MNPAEVELRLRCVELATRAGGDVYGVVSVARDIHLFVTSQSDKTPRELIDAALDQANVS